MFCFRCTPDRRVSLEGGKINAKKKKLVLQRQSSNTSRSSRGSGKSNGSALQKRIEEMCLNKQPDEWQKEQEYTYRRHRRKLQEKQFRAQTARVKKVQILFIPSALGVICGIVMTFGATIRTLSDGSLLWTHREYFVVIGPIVLTVGIIIFFVAEGLRHVMLERLQKQGEFKFQQEIHPDFHKTNRREHENGTGINCKLRANKLERADDYFLCSSMSSSSSAPDFAGRWARAMNFSFDKSRLERTESIELDSSIDSGVIRMLMNAPEIEITDTDEHKDSVANVGNNHLVKSMKKTESHQSNEINSTVLCNENSKLFQSFCLEGISEESLVEN